LLALSSVAFGAGEPEDLDSADGGDFKKSPHAEFGEFNEEEDEASDTRFFQHGRFFGVSAGLGFQGVTGNRGLLWQGGFPTIDVKFHYWFDFQFALDIAFYSAPHFYVNPTSSSRVNASMVMFGVDLKYYIPTKNLGAALTFAGPYLVGGFGGYTKSETDVTSATVTPDASIGVGIGWGLEFVIRHRKTYFQLENKFHFVNFNDRLSTRFAPTIADLGGVFYTLTGSLLLTW